MDYLIAISDQLAPHLRSFRKARGLSQTDLALRLGVTQSRVAAIERHPAVVSAGQFLDILQALGVELVLRDRDAPAGATSPVSKLSGTGPQGEW